MAAGQEAVSFDDIIQADRQRRKNEALAQEIFGRNRRSSTPSNGLRKPGTGPSLASRVGITKASQRSVSAMPRLKTTLSSDIGQDSQRNLTPRNAPARSPALSNPMARTAHIGRRNERLHEVAQNGTSDRQSSGLSIRGLAGPYIVMASNFAPGTTAADIESAMVNSVGEMQSCRIITSTPTVMAEMAFVEKQSADNVIATFNNQKADGRILHVYMKHGTTPNATTAPVRKPIITPIVDLSRDDNAYDNQREQYDRNRRRADPEFQDGSYGFDTKKADDMDVDMDDRKDDRRDNWRGNRRDGDRSRNGGREDGYRPLYSDNLYPRPRGRGFR